MSTFTRHNPHSHRCVHISALQGGIVPHIVDDRMPADFHCIHCPTLDAEALRAAAADPSCLQLLVKPRHVQQFQRLTTRSAKGDEPWRSALAKLAKEALQDTADGLEQPSRPETADPHHLQLDQRQSCVLRVLCRILQTRDTAAVRAWLAAASSRERTLAADIIRSSVANRDEYFAAAALESRIASPAGGTSDSRRTRSGASRAPTSHKSDWK